MEHDQLKELLKKIETAEQLDQELESAVLDGMNNAFPGKAVWTAHQAKILEAKDISIRIVSMPSWELFEKTSQEYKDKVLPPDVNIRIAVEAGISMGWERYTGSNGAIIGINKFGASAPGNIVMEKFGFTPENIVQKATKLLKG